MRLRLVDRRSESLREVEAATLARLEDICGAPGRPNWETNLVLVDDPEMARLNEEFRGREGVTDVLSFSYLEFTGAGDPDLAAGAGFARVDLWFDPVQKVAEDRVQAVGEIVLALDFVDRQCQENRCSFADELALLTVHGVLHVLGWDHADPDQTEAMRRVEADLLGRCGVRHPLQRGGEETDGR